MTRYLWRCTAALPWPDAFLLWSQILETRIEAPEIASSLTALSEFYGPDNTPAARRRLRSTIENEGVKVSQAFLASAEGVIKVRSWRRAHVMRKMCAQEDLHVQKHLILATSSCSRCRGAGFRLHLCSRPARLSAGAGRGPG